MKIALIGTRGVPANYGGFETCVEEIGRRLVERGHEVTVYCRKNNYEERLPDYLGMKLVYLPSLRKKSLDTLSHTFVSILHAIFCSYDVFMVFNAANSPCLVVPRLLGKNIAINTDGLEWKRGKWGKSAKRYYKFSEWLATKLTNVVVADSRGIQDYYRSCYGVESRHIAYGAYISKSCKSKLLESIQLSPKEYFLQITRFEPENNPLLTIQAYKKLKTDKKLLLVGGVPYESKYSDLIKKEVSEGVILPGPIYDKDLLNELWCNCYTYIHGNEVGGTNPALLQTMASGCFTIAINVSFSHNVLRDAGIYFDNSVEDLTCKMQWALDHPGLLDAYKERAVEYIRADYSWDHVTDGYEALFNELIGGKHQWRIPRI